MVKKLFFEIIDCVLPIFKRNPKIRLLFSIEIIIESVRKGIIYGLKSKTENKKQKLIYIKCKILHLNRKYLLNGEI
jgi:hypothetical protein